MATVRKALPNDGAKFSALDQETEFMLMEPGERKLSIEKQVEIINESSDSKSRILLIASKRGVIVGFLGGHRGAGNKKSIA